MTLRALGFEAREDEADEDSVATASGFDARLRSGKVIPPGEVARIEMGYVAEGDVMQASASLVVDTEVGCQAFPVMGVKVADGGLIDSPLAVDFGVLAVGERSEPMDVAFHFTAVTDDAAEVLLGTGGAEPSAVFEVVDAIPETILMSCERHVARVRARAPEETGVVEGTLWYETFANGFVGIGAIPLRLLVRDD